MARGEGVKLILEGVAEGWRIAGEIAAATVPVLVTPIENTPASFEALGATPANARRLADAGVLGAIEGNENGRASRRDRGCRDVLITVVAGSLKKKIIPPGYESHTLNCYHNL